MNLCRCTSDPSAFNAADKNSRPLPSPGPGLSLAVASVPMQPWETPYDASKAFKQGTIFPSLDLPFFLTGGGTNG